MPPQKIDNVLPPDFDGVFRFTNWTDREFSARWNNIEYKFAPMATSPMIISGATPEEVQHIRRKFAYELAEREFYKSDRFKAMDALTPAGSGSVPAIYSETDIKPFMMKALEPLPIAPATAKLLPRDDTSKYSSETKVMDEKDLKSGTSLVGTGSEPIIG